MTKTTKTTKTKLPALRIEQTIYGNWYGYISGKRAQMFFGSDQADQACDWVKTQAMATGASFKLREVASRSAIGQTLAIVWTPNAVAPVAAPRVVVDKQRGTLEAGDVVLDIVGRELFKVSSVQRAKARGYVVVLGTALQERNVSATLAGRSSDWLRVVRS